MTAADARLIDTGDPIRDCPMRHEGDDMTGIRSVLRRVLCLLDFHMGCGNIESSEMHVKCTFPHSEGGV